MKNQNLRQGDVLLVPIDKIPMGAKLTKNNTLVEGEKTGHHHIATGGCAVAVRYSDEKYLESDGTGVLKHLNVNKGHQWTGEHYDLPIPEGVYRVIPQRGHAYGEDFRLIID